MRQLALLAAAILIPFLGFRALDRATEDGRKAGIEHCRMLPDECPPYR